MISGPFCLHYKLHNTYVCAMYFTEKMNILSKRLTIRNLIPNTQNHKLLHKLLRILEKLLQLTNMSRFTRILEILIEDTINS
jgi:hypothetical protein